MSVKNFSTHAICHLGLENCSRHPMRSNVGANWSRLKFFKTSVVYSIVFFGNGFNRQLSETMVANADMENSRADYFVEIVCSIYQIFFF